MKSSIELTSSAEKRILEITKEKDTNLRLIIIDGGCKGLKYDFKLDKIKNSDDIIFESNGAKLIIDAKSLSIIDNSIIDYKESLMGSSFTVENPSASSSCKCGSSFSL